MTFPIISGPAERVFGVHRISPAAPEMEVRARTRHWAEGGVGDAPVGVLGVPVDNATGYAVIAGAPPGHWSVTTELSLDVFGPIPTEGSDLIVSAALVHSNASTGFSEGEVVDAQGRTVARIRQRGLFVAGYPGQATSAAVPSAGPDPVDLGAFFGVVSNGSRELGAAEVDVTADLINPMRNLHGGVGLCLVEWMARESLQAVNGDGLHTTSIHVAYLRPVPLGATVRVATEVLHCGRSFGLVQVTVSLKNGKPVLVGRVTGGAA